MRGCSRTGRSEICGYLLEQLQAVRVVVVREEHHPGVPPAAALSEPRESRVPLLGGAWHPGALEPARGEHVQVGVGHPAAGQEARHHVCACGGILHQDPVEAGHLAESVSQAGQLRFLHRARVRGGDGVDDRQGGLIVGSGVSRRPGPGSPLRSACATGRRSPNRPFTVDVDHDDDDEDPGQQDEEAAEKHGFHGEAKVTAHLLALTPSQKGWKLQQPPPTSNSHNPAADVSILGPL